MDGDNLKRPTLIVAGIGEDAMRVLLCGGKFDGWYCMVNWETFGINIPYDFAGTTVYAHYFRPYDKSLIMLADKS